MPNSNLKGLRDKQRLCGGRCTVEHYTSLYSRYGSATFKQVYIYGGLGTRPTELARDFGMAWNIGECPLFPFLQTADPAIVQKLKQRVAAELKTMFASRDSKEISLVEMLRLDVFAGYGTRSTGEKYLVNPAKE